VEYPTPLVAGQAPREPKMGLNGERGAGSYENLLQFGHPVVDN